MNTYRAIYTSSAFAMVLCVSELAGCGGPGTVEGSIQSGQRGQGLSITSIESLDGHYAANSCIDPGQSGSAKRPVTDQWSAGPAAMAALLPSVVLNDQGCALVVDGMQIKDAGGTARSAAPVNGSFTLSKDMFLAAPVLWRYNDGADRDFYVNAMLTPGNFSGAFDIQLVYSSTPDAATMVPSFGQYMTVSVNSLQDSGVAAPQYNLDLSGLNYQKDAGLKVTQASGSGSLTAVGQTAEDYMVQAGTCPTDLATIKSGYSSMAAIATPISDADFGLAPNTSLPLSMCVTARHCDAGQSNVCSFQLFDVTFN